jgi:ribosomal protein L16/L10AE
MKTTAVKTLTLTSLIAASLALAAIAQDVAVDPSKVALGKTEYSHVSTRAIQTASISATRTITRRTRPMQG